MREASALEIEQGHAQTDGSDAVSDTRSPEKRVEFLYSDLSRKELLPSLVHHQLPHWLQRFRRGLPPRADFWHWGVTLLSQPPHPSFSQEGFFPTTPSLLFPRRIFSNHPIPPWQRKKRRTSHGKMEEKEKKQRTRIFK